MELIIEKEKSGDSESRKSAQRFLEIFKTAIAKGENRMTGRDLRLFNLENEVRKTDPKKADSIREFRKDERTRREKELEQYYADLRARIKRM